MTVDDKLDLIWRELTDLIHEHKRTREMLYDRLKISRVVFRSPVDNMDRIMMITRIYDTPDGVIIEVT
jgi:hypothetical protein